MARPFDPSFKFSDRERWMCFYPAYINSKKTVSDGRRIPKDQAVENPTHEEIKTVCVAAGLTVGVENKTYPRELYPRDMTYRGRIRVQFKDDNGQPKYEKFPTKKSLMLYVAETIPKLKTRIQKQNQAQQQAAQQAKQSSGKSKGKNKKR
ncbi:SRP19 [Bugula neritina]|uniref:SRP19 n=1 Tax=Bugula neritina TaxID=10212 RepID=A0A7J7J964_BUGNE|nr:SRP19 [Bugula neritina]